MNLAIQVSKIDSGDYLAQVDWSKGDAGQIGTPGAVMYGESDTEAYSRLKERLEAKGHTIIEPNPDEN